MKVRRSCLRRLLAVAALLVASGCAQAARSGSPQAAAPPAPPSPAPAQQAEELARRVDRVGSRADDLENAMARLGARIETLERRLDQLAAQLAHARASQAPSAAGGAVPPPPRETGPPQPPPTTTARELYDAGMARVRSGDLPAAALIFQDLIARHPNDPLRESAQFQMAEIFYREKDYGGALKEFENLLAVVPNGAKTPDILLKIGLSYRGLGEEANARRTWERLIREHPRSAASRQAQTLLRSRAR